MPAIQSVEILPDGFRIVTTNIGTIELHAAQVPPLILVRSVNDVESWVNETFLPPLIQFTDPEGLHFVFYVAVHVFSTVPLSVAVQVSDFPIAPGWWQ